MTILFIRAVLLYLFVLAAAKGMGKRQLGQLQPYELVGLLVISEMASLAMQSNSIPLVYSLIPIAAVSLLLVVISAADLKSERLRRLICGQPVAVIAKGVFREQAMSMLRLNLNDLEEMCRAQGYFDITDVDWAVLETNGQLSILPKSDKRPLEVGDLLEEAPKESPAWLLIRDGRLDTKALQAAGQNENWLNKQLQQAGLKTKETFVAGLDASGEFFCQPKEARR